MSIDEYIDQLTIEAEANLKRETKEYSLWGDTDNRELTLYWNPDILEWTPVKNWAIKGYVKRRFKDLLDEKLGYT